MSSRRKLKALLNGSVFLMFLLGLPLPGWTAPTHETTVEVSGGVMAFTEETEGFAGGSVRFYVSPRISLGPEVTFVQGENHKHWIATGNAIFDFITPQDGRRLIPFGLVGGGVFQTREKFANQTLTSREGAFTAGGGIRMLLGDRITLGADLRVGWELHVRAGATVGLRLGR